MDQDEPIQNDAKASKNTGQSSDYGEKNCDLNQDCNIRQLQTRVLPPYMPSNPKFQISFPPEEFRCKECGDRFLFSSSLKTHKERKSVHISYYCEDCEQLLSFYNRCTFLAHVHLHSKHHQLPVISKAHVVPISREMLDLPPPYFTDSSHDEGAVVLPNALDAPSEPSVGNENGVKEQEELSNDCSKNKIKCPECGLLFKTENARIEHISNPKSPAVLSIKCSHCSYVCPSKCSLQAHQRMHTNTFPYVCPECGELFTDVQEVHNGFQYHVNQVCFHHSRILAYKCLICSSVQASIDLVIKHVMGFHAEAYYKCDSCPMAFKAVVTFINHKAIAHPTGKAECKTIYKCPLCDTVFHCSKQLTTHLNAHFKDQPCEVHFLFKCSECDNKFESKNLLMTHMTKMHRLSCHICGLTFYSAKILYYHVARAHVVRDNKKCKLCDRTFKTLNGLNAHRQFNCKGASVRLVCVACGLTMTNKTELAIHGRWHIKKDTVLCLLCNNQPFESKERLWSHLKVHVQGMKYPGKCFQCETTFSGTLDALNHLKNEHQDIPGNEICCESTNCCIKLKDKLDKLEHHICWICRRECFLEQESLHRHLKNTHSIALPDRPPIKLRIPLQVVKSALEKAEHAKKSKDEFFGKRLSSGSTCISPKKAKFGGEDDYVCAKCDFHSQNAEEFQNHIVSHKTDKRSYQCKQCGACFVVEPSLKKHLFIAHKIQDAEVYLAENSVTDVDCMTAVDGTTSSSESSGKYVSANSLECNICFASFDTDTALRTHLRSHGMAFIQSKKMAQSLQNTTNNS